MPVTSLDIQRLKNAADLKDLAAILGVKPAQLAYVLYVLPLHLKYTDFKIPKKNGGERIISAPDSRLKNIQKRLAAILMRIELELESEYRKNSILSHGFKKDLSIITNAKRHRNKRYVFNIDLDSFFPSINFGRVRGFFIKNNHFALSPKISTLIAQVACHNNSLPQGSPCSPVISNLIGSILDHRIGKLSADCRCTYTRYVDDITFSTNERNFPERIAVKSTNSHEWAPSEELVSRISASGFAISPSKTRMQYTDSRQSATGLVINKKINVPNEYYKITRAMCHRLFVDGKAFAPALGKKIPINLGVIRGRLGYTHYIRSLSEGDQNQDDYKKRNYHKTYFQFLNYISFWGISEPAIICEGKTDNIYIRSALRALKHKFPTLIEKKGGKNIIKLKFFKYTKTAKSVQDLSGGNGQLKNLLYEYKQRTSIFKKTPKYPVIIITDVDKGAKDLFLAMGKFLKKTVAGEEAWYYLFSNLYVIPVPKGLAVETSIEDLFETSLLETKIDGKTFDRTNHEKDGSKFYSKFTFATKIVAPGIIPINYVGFEPLLKAIQDVQADYASKIKSIPSELVIAA